MSQNESDQIDIEIPGYEVHRLLGTGGMARVFQATQLNLKRQVALKVMLPEIASRERSVQRFLSEAQMAAQVAHVNVVLVYDLGNADGQPYIAMELVDGGNVVDLMKQVGGRLPVKRALELLRDAANGTSAIHAAGLLHRDIKPHNILINRQGVGKISDLGLAFAANAGDSISRANATIGTPAYMSPEQADGTRDLDLRTDIYSLGATLFTMVSGQAPFGGQESWSVINQVLSATPPDPRQFGVPEGVAVLIERSMAKDPDNRHQSMRELLGLIEQAIAVEEGVAPTPSAAPPPGQGQAQQQPDQSQFRQPQQPPPQPQFQQPPPPPGQSQFGPPQAAPDQSQFQQPQPAPNQPQFQVPPPAPNQAAFQQPQPASGQSQFQQPAQPAPDQSATKLGHKRSFNISELYPEQQEEEDDPFAAVEGPSTIFRKAAVADSGHRATAAEIATRRHDKHTSTAQHIKAMQELQQQASENPNQFQEGLAPGSTFGTYRVQNPMYETTCSTVYLAAHAQSQKQVFLVIIKQQMSGEDNFRTWWSQYTETLKRCLHQHLSPFLEAGEEDGRLWAVFDHGREVNLTHILADEGTIKEEEALSIVGQLASGLKVYEDNDITHRLIDPGNIYVDTEGVARLGPPCCDMPGENTYFLGLTLTWTHLAIAHQSPERTVGEHKRISIATDLYSLGALLFSLLCGRPPFEHDDTLNLTLRVMSSPLPDVHQVLPDLAESTYEILGKIFVKDLSERLRSTGDLLFMLNRLNVGTPIKQQLKAILHSKAVYPKAGEDMLQVMEYLEENDPDRGDLLKAASLIVLQQPSLKLWQAIHQLGEGTWMERKADSIIDVLDGAGLKEARKIVPVGGKDGAADLQQAIDDAPAFSRISVRPGEYAGGITITKPLFLVGEGRAKEVVIRSHAASFAIKIACDGVMLCGLTILGEPAQAGQKAFGLEVVDGRCVVCNCFLQAVNLPAVAVHGENCRPFIADCRIRQSGSSGIFFFDNATGTVENCEVSHNQLAGIEVAKFADPTIRSCNIVKNQKNGVLVWQNGQGTVDKCTINGNKLPGLEVRGKGSATVSHCRVHSGEHCGVLVHEKAQCTCQECEIANNKMPGAAAKSGGHLTLERCRLLKGMRSGVVVLEEGTVSMTDTGVQGNMGAAVEVRPHGRIQAENCVIEYGKTIGVVAHGNAVGYVTDCVFDGADPLQAAKIEKGCRVAIEGMKTKGS